MAYEKQNWLPYDDNKTEEENIETGAVVTAERMNHIEDGVEAQATKIEFDAHLDDKENPHEVTAHQVGALTAEETSTNVIYQLVGKDKVRLTFNADYKNKVSGSTIENPHWAGGGTSNTLVAPNGPYTEYSQEAYDQKMLIDGVVKKSSTTTNASMPLAVEKYNVIEIVKQGLGEQFFLDRGAITNAEQSQVIREITVDDCANIWAFGSGPTGNKVTFGVWSYRDSNWQGLVSHSKNIITKLSRPTNNLKVYLGDDGFMNYIAYAEASDGAAVSAINIDYANFELTVEVSMNEHIKSMIAAYRRENIDTSFMKISSLANGADDWNTYTDIGTYGITTGTGANAPVNSAGTLLVQGYGAGGTSRTQLFINSNSIRYRHYQGGGNWTAWQTLTNIGQTDNKYMNISSTPIVDQDWNTLDTVGTYSVEGANGDNRPSINDTWGTLLVQSSKHSSSMLTQLFISSGNIYFRRKSGEATWGPWRTPTPAAASGAEIDTGTNNTKMVTPQGLATSYYSKYITIGAWTTLTLNTGFKSADNTTVKYRILEYPQPNGAVKKKIEFDGAWTNDAGSLGSSSGTQSQWCILPENLRPAQTKMFPAQCSKFSTTGRIAFTPTGICYGAQDSGAAVTYMYVTGMSYWIGE